MTVFVDSKQAVLNYINAANSVTRFNLDNVTMSKPKPVEGSRHMDKTLKNTYATVVPGTAGIFKGRKSIYYNRLLLNDFARFRATRVLKTPAVTSVHGLLPAIQFYYAIKLSTADVEDDPITLDQDGKATVTVRAKADSPLWLGSITFDLIPGGYDLTQAVTTLWMTEFKYPIPNFDTGSSAALIAYPIDATYYRDELLMIEEGELHGDGLAKVVEALLALDYSSDGKLLWNGSAASTEWSLAGATVFYNGLNEAALPTNPAFKYVIGIELRADVSIPSGRFYIHYSDPENTDEI